MLFIIYLLYSYIVIGAYTNTMNNRSTPDNHIRNRKQHEKNNRVHRVKSQPEPMISTIRLFNPKKSDKVDYWHVKPRCKLDLNEVALKLMEKLEVQLYVAAYFGDAFDVFTLGSGVAWGDVFQATADTLKEMR